MQPERPARGFTLVELLVSMAIVSIVMAGATGFFIALATATARENRTAAADAALRLGLELITADLRAARYGVPGERLEVWIPWVGGLSENPRVVHGGNGPDRLDVARCTAEPIALLSANAPLGATRLALRSTSANTLRSLLNVNQKRLIRIGSEDFAHVTRAPADSPAAPVEIDTEPDPSITDPPGAANPGLSRPYVAGTPVCRVDVHTWSVDTLRGILRLNQNSGAGAQPTVDGIIDLRIGSAYTIALTARSPWPDPETGIALVRSLSTRVAARNP